jgi:hypothetical protein
MPTHFMGREDALGTIEAGLRHYEGRAAITALHGLRGVGKTVLAAAYAERHRGNSAVIERLRHEGEDPAHRPPRAPGIGGAFLRLSVC